MAELSKYLHVKPIKDAVEEAISVMDAERKGLVTGLYTRWETINRGKMKYWRFGSVTAIAGMSGSGKSAILNMIEDDFTNPELNPTFLRHQDKDGNWVGEDKIVLLAFKYEMTAANEILRNLSGKVSKSFAYLLSAENPKGIPIEEKAKYNNISDEEFDYFSNQVRKLSSRPVKYVENAGNLDQLENTVRLVQSENPGKKLIITLDHTLLSMKLNEKDDLELMSRTAKTAIKLNKVYGALVIFLSQMNGEIEKLARRENADFHFPVKTDIHAQNQIFWACDDVMIFHRPELLDIKKYGKIPFPIDTRDVIHCNWVKSRFNFAGSIWFLNKLKEGKIMQVQPEQIKWKESLGIF